MPEVPQVRSADGSDQMTLPIELPRAVVRPAAEVDRLAVAKTIAPRSLTTAPLRPASEFICEGARRPAEKGLLALGHTPA